MTGIVCVLVVCVALAWCFPGGVTAAPQGSLGSEDYWVETRLSLQAIGLGRTWECPAEHVLAGSGSMLVMWSSSDYYAGRDILVSAVNACADTPGCASVSMAPSTGYGDGTPPVCGSESFVSLSVYMTLCGVRVPDGGQLSLAADTATYAVAPGDEAACTPPQALVSQPWYASGCGGGTYCLLSPWTPSSGGHGIDFVDALVSGRGPLGSGVLVPTTCVGETRNVGGSDTPPLTIGGTGLVNTTERGTCVCREPAPAPPGSPAFPLFCSPAPLWPSSVDDRPAVLPRVAPLRSPTFAGTPWSFPVLPVAGFGGALTLTVRRLTVGLLMHLTEDPVTLVSRPQSPDHIVVLLTRPGHPPASTPGVTPDVTIAVDGTTDALEEFTRLCVEEADVAAGGGCKSWSVRPAGDSWSSTDCSDAEAPWAAVELYMSTTGDADTGHEVTRDRMYAAGSWAGGTTSVGSARWYDNGAIDGSHPTAAACFLSGPAGRWLLVFRAGMTGQVCTQPASSGVPSSVCTPSTRTRYGTTSTPLGPPEPWTMEEFAVDAFFEDDAAYDIRVYDTACVGSGADGAGLFGSFCACSSPVDDSPDACNGVLSDFIVSNVSSPDAEEIGAPWAGDEAVVAALTAHHAALPPPGSLPSYGDVHAGRVVFGPAYGSCNDPDVDLVTPTLRHLIKTASFNGDDIVDPTTGSIPASTTDELLDIAMQLCATEAWQSGYENVEPWTCSGVSWRLATPGDECHDAPTWEFMVCTGPGGVNTSDVVAGGDTSWTPCQWPWNTDTPGPGVVWAPMQAGAVTGVCVDCVCTSPVTESATEFSQTCVPAPPEDLSTFPGGLLSGGSGSSANTAWDVAWGLGLQPYEVFWDSRLDTGPSTPLYGDTSRSSGQGGGTLHYTVRVLRVTSQRSAASLASRTFWVRNAGDAAWAAMSTCAEAYGDTVREVSWDPVRVCGSADPGVQSYGFLRVICGTEPAGYPTLIQPWTLTFASSGCPPNTGFRTDALNALRPGVIRLVSGLAVALPRFPLQRWTALGGVPMNLMRRWADGGSGDFTWVAAGCPDYTGSITRVSPGRGLTACPNGAVTRPGTGHGQPPLSGTPIPTSPLRQFVATRTWRGLSASCPPGGTSSTAYVTQYFLPSIGQQMEPLGRLDAVTTLATRNALESCMDDPLCNGVIASSRFGSWNPIVPQSLSFMTVQWAVTTCSSLDSDTQETSFSVADDAAPATNAAECGRNAPTILQSSAFDKRSVTASLRGVFSSIGFVPCVDPVSETACVGSFPDDLYAAGGVFSGVLDVSTAPQPFVSTCVRSGVRNSTCTCARTVTVSSGCSACDTEVWEGGVAASTAATRPYGNWSLETPGVGDAMDCQAKPVNLCAPRGVFTGWDPDGVDPEPWCAACSAQWSGTHCRTCSGCHPDPSPLTTRSAESVGVSCASTPEAALDAVCDCSGSSEWRKPEAGAPVGDDPDTRTCSVCADARQFARPFKYYEPLMGSGTPVGGDLPGWCWSVLESDAAAHPVVDGGPVVTGGWCESYVNVSASNKANECVYNASPLCFDPNTDGCVGWASTCNVYGGSNETASRSTGACVCQSPFAGPACDACDADHPYDFISWSRSQFPEPCYAWPDVCDARAAAFGQSSDMYRGWVDDADGDLTPSSGNANHPYSITDHCACVGNPRGPSFTDCVVCEPGRTLFSHVVGEGLAAHLVTVCLLPHPAVSAGGTGEEACGPGGNVGSVPEVTTTMVCVCSSGWSHETPGDVLSPCTVCATDAGYVMSPDNQTCAPCPGFGSLSYMSTCPSGTGGCAWNASAPVFADPVTDLTIVGYGAATCDCPGGRREWAPLVFANETHGVVEAAVAGKRSPCGPCIADHFGVTCQACDVDCGHGACAVITEGFRPGCTCDPMWALSLTHLPWYMQPCSSCAPGSVAVSTTGILNQVLGLDTYPTGVPTSCVACPPECPTTCTWRTVGLGPGANESGLACPCALESRVTLPRPVTPSEAAAIFPDVYPDPRVWVCGGCMPGLLGDPEAGYPCGATCPGGCGGDAAGQCVWNVTDVMCVCEPGYTHSVSGSPGDACTSCAPGYVLSSFSVESGHATCAACPSEACPPGTRCAWSPSLGRTVCTCADVFRVLTVSTGLCGDCIPGRYPSDGVGGTSCTAVCPPSCGAGGTCVRPPITDPPAVLADCECEPGYVHATPGVNSSSCSVCADGYELDPATGECHLCRATCEFGMSCVWDEGLQSPRCDCAAGHFRDAVVTLPDNSSWTDCSSTDGCLDDVHVGPLCVACPAPGCGTHGVCEWSTTTGTSVCVCDAGWVHAVSDDARTPCTGCAPGAFGPRCESCGGGSGCGAWPHTECSYSSRDDSVRCTCLPPYADPLGGSDCSACAASLPLRVGPSCEPCRVGGCGPGSECGWSADEGSPVCVCSPGFVNTDGPTSVCRPCASDETTTHCIPCPAGCSPTTGERCVEVAVAGESPTSACSCIPGYFRYDEDRETYPHCYMAFEQDAISAALAGSPSPSPGIRTLGPTSLLDTALAQTLITVGASVIIIASSVSVVLCVRHFHARRKADTAPPPVNADTDAAVPIRMGWKFGRADKNPPSWRRPRGHGHAFS